MDRGRGCVGIPPGVFVKRYHQILTIVREIDADFEYIQLAAERLRLPMAHLRARGTP